MTTDVENDVNVPDLTDGVGGGDEYLTFSLANEEYGVDILRVQELRGWEPVTRVPNSPDYVKGVLNLRGSIVPVIDLRVRFDLPFEEYSSLTVVIVLSVKDKKDGHERIISVVVDEISDVVKAKLSDIQTTPKFGTALDVEYISGLADAGGKMLMLLNVDTMLSVADMPQY
ncbi:MAG: chemotaxis protein CheW [Gammaproteobacteria bacterium]|nr:chemotaxis protein CheW [Gammaproteobacteria bacterium]